LSEVIERARSEGAPQTITRHGAERAVVLSIEDYRVLVAQKPDFKTYLLGGPKADDFAIERDLDTGRPVDL
jgi:antitoxin Phd